MRAMVVGAVMAAGLLCGGTEQAEAYSYTLFGSVTSADLPNGGASVGDKLAIYIGINPDALDGNTGSAYFLDLTTGAFGFGDGFYGTFGSKTDIGASVVGIDMNGSFGSNGGIDGAYYASFQLVNGKLPNDPEQSFKPIAAIGSGSIGAYTDSYDPDTGLPLNGFNVGFTVDFVSAQGKIAAVPLPASASLFGFALIGLGAVGISFRHVKTMPKVARLTAQ